MFISIKTYSLFLLFLIPILFFGQKYDYIGDYDNNGLAIVTYKNKFGIIDQNQKEILPLEYTNIKHIGDYYSDTSYYQVSLNDKIGIFTSQGKQIIPIIFNAIELLSNNIFLVNKDTKYGFIDSLGNELTPVKYQDIFNDTNIFIAMQDTKLGNLNDMGKEISPFAYDSISKIPSTSKYLRVRINNKEGFFDVETEKEIIPVLYEKLEYTDSFLTNSFLIAKLGGKYGVIDLSNHTIIPFEYQDIVRYRDLLAAKQNNRWGVINFTNKILVPFKYDTIQRRGNGHFIVTLNHKSGIIGIRNQIIIPIQYDKIEDRSSSENKVFAILNSKYGSINTDTGIFSEIQQNDIIIVDENKLDYESKIDPSPPCIPVIKVVNENTIFDGNVNEQAEYSNGLETLRSFVDSHLEYPAKALEHGTEGKVLIKFVIEKDGTISNATIARNIGDGCGAEAVRVLKLTSGKWKPAKINGEPVRSVFRFPVAFRLPIDPILQKDSKK